jgi:hypothetical protein
MQVNNLIADKPIQVFSEKNEFILIKENNLKLSLSKTTGEANQMKDYKPKSLPISCYGIVGCIEAKIQKYMIYIDEIEKKRRIFRSDSQ